MGDLCIEWKPESGEWWVIRCEDEDHGLRTFYNYAEAEAYVSGYHKGQQDAGREAKGR